MTLVLSSAIFGPAFGDPAVTELLGDEAYFRALLEVEVVLARGQARLGIMTEQAASAIEAAAAALPFDAAALSAGVQRDGIPVIALVSQLRAAAGAGPDQLVHLGATSQDIMDSATVLVIKRVLEHLRNGIVALMARLAALAAAHRDTLVAARTHGQQALPASFGLKVALWASPLPRHLERLRELSPRLFVVQLGGAAGTLAALGPQALELVEEVAAELGLGAPDLPWHTQRDTMAELGSWLSLVTGTLGKLAQDVILLGQSEVAEVSEAPPGQRGGSSTMPQKNNPMRSEQILAAARAVATQQAGLLHALVQENERATHGWQVEWLCLPPMLALAAGALKNALALLDDLQIYPERMRHNITAQHGLVLAEAAVSALSAELPRSEAQALVKTAAARARHEERLLIDVLREDMTRAFPHHRVDWQNLAAPENHLGHAGALIDRVLARLSTAIKAG